MTLFAVATVLNQEENKKIHDIWDDLDIECEINAVKFSPIPHFSWFTYQSVSDLTALEEEIRNWADSLEPFLLEVNGLGLFTGENPIIYLPIVRNYLLSEIHFDLVQKINSLVMGPSSFYTSEKWIPHITLAIRDLTTENLSCAITQCIKHDLSFPLYIDHVAILYMDEKTFGLHRKFPFGMRKYHIASGGSTK